MALGLRWLSSSGDKPIRPLFNTSSHYYMLPKKLNAPLEAVDPEIADITEHEKTRQWKNTYARSVLWKHFGWIQQNGEQLCERTWHSNHLPGATERITCQKSLKAGEYYDVETRLEIFYRLKVEVTIENKEEEKEEEDCVYHKKDRWGSSSYVAANVQPLSGSPANFQVYTALLKPHDRITRSSSWWTSFSWLSEASSDKNNHDLQLEKSATLFRPNLIVAGASAYAHPYDYAHIRKVCALSYRGVTSTRVGSTHSAFRVPNGRHDINTLGCVRPLEHSAQTLPKARCDISMLGRVRPLERSASGVPNCRGDVSEFSRESLYTLGM
ncbi:PREDICTED: serine [Prunus dulcis]|uniref:PREDICTED: serine n=1 Tax=Prunus dulcis TaxID=3755 RepID=A0A5E4GKM4_PRUDU|nr:PREDICTED: serine [Prunus dulcis]